jgi:hypothetical protein
VRSLLWKLLPAFSHRIHQASQDFQDLVFRSWSWCCWKGGRSCQLEGVLTNVHEWLADHTWIVWYIRDGCGNLRPVWKSAKSKASDSVERRWKGYKDVSPDIEFANFQEKAQKKLGNPTRRARKISIHFMTNTTGLSHLMLREEFTVDFISACPVFYFRSTMN